MIYKYKILMNDLRYSLENKMPSIFKIGTYFPALWMPPGTANNELRSSEFLLKLFESYK